MREYAEYLREYRVDASLREPFAPHNPTTVAAHSVMLARGRNVRSAGLTNKRALAADAVQSVTWADLATVTLAVSTINVIWHIL